MITQSVLYSPYTGNPKAAQGIVDLARQYLREIPGTELRVGPAIESTRAVAIGNGCVIKTTTWANEALKDAYFKHPNLIMYVKEVLKGWKLEGDEDTAQSAEAFINDILGSKPSGRRWVRNLSVPDNQVLWGGESIILYQWAP
jgi:hypothetical protein